MALPMLGLSRLGQIGLRILCDFLLVGKFMVQELPYHFHQV
ncbi:MAG: hypothetical protein GFH25_541218n14 [Chloroflexi bacterium AL-N10]|nr:hypothetical protein [Chloroflexi bacterium AL-N1]NOK69876.1 hypothetical protein [Chloroflexi bacterium AL-N10]NOK73827.1 hypothetical protein [Chloroflexi bacterium AL-N5]NOK91609.1 hypothetical protein [Chloroflexi bacterium AL-N15]